MCIYSNRDYNFWLIIAIKVIYQERNKEYTDPDSINEASAHQNQPGHMGQKN